MQGGPAISRNVCRPRQPLPPPKKIRRTHAAADIIFYGSYNEALKAATQKKSRAFKGLGQLTHGNSTAKAHSNLLAKWTEKLLANDNDPLAKLLGHEPTEEQEAQHEHDFKKMVDILKTNNELRKFF